MFGYTTTGQKFSKNQFYQTQKTNPKSLNSTLSKEDRFAVRRNSDLENPYDQTPLVDQYNKT